MWSLKIQGVIAVFFLLGCSEQCLGCFDDRPSTSSKYKVLFPENTHRIKGDKILLLNKDSLVLSVWEFCDYFKFDVYGEWSEGDYGVEHWCTLEEEEFFLEIFFDPRILDNENNEEHFIEYYAYGFKGSSVIAEGDSLFQLNSVPNSPNLVFTKDSLRFKKLYWQTFYFDLASALNDSELNDRKLIPVRFYLDSIRNDSFNSSSNSSFNLDLTAELRTSEEIYPDNLSGLYDICTGQFSGVWEDRRFHSALALKYLALQPVELNAYGGWETDTIAVFMVTEKNKDTLTVFIDNYIDESCARY